MSDLDARMNARAARAANQMGIRQLVHEAAAKSAGEVDTARWVELEEIVIEPRIQVRVGGLNDETVERYAAVMAETGDYEPFPPVVVFRDVEDNVLRLSAGFHRAEAARRAIERLRQEGREPFPGVKAEIRTGGFTDAYWFAITDNLKNGLQMTSADQKEALRRLLGYDMQSAEAEEYATMSDRKLAALIGVHYRTIGRWRNEFAESLTGANDPVSTTRTYITKHGTAATMDTSRIREANQQRAQPPPRPEPAPPRIQGTAQPSGRFTGIPADKLEYLARQLAVEPAAMERTIRYLHFTEQDIHWMLQMETRGVFPREEMIRVLQAQLGNPPPAPEIVLDLEPDEQPGMVTDHIPGDEQAGARRLLADLSTALQELRSMALALPKLGDLDALAVLDDTALDGVLGLIDETGADLAGHEDGRGEYVPGVLDHLAGWRAQVQEMLDDGNGAE